MGYVGFAGYTFLSTVAFVGELICLLNQSSHIRGHISGYPVDEVLRVGGGCRHLGHAVYRDDIAGSPKVQVSHIECQRILPLSLVKYYLNTVPLNAFSIRCMAGSSSVCLADVGVKATSVRNDKGLDKIDSPDRSKPIDA